MNILVDAMGGDKGPKVVVKGSILALKELNVDITLVGDESIIRKELSENNYTGDRISIIHAEEVINNEDEAAMAIRRKKNSSMIIALNLLKDEKYQGFISTGNTGALITGGTLITKRIKGIERAAIASPFPTENGMALLLDAGANADCKPDYLKQFGLMGSIYYEKLFEVSSPKVGLANIGVEKEKGNLLVKEAYELLENSNINFIGNVEARDIPRGKADVIVCDGFVGNIILKLTEGLAFTIFDILKDEFMKSFSRKIGALLLKSSFKAFKSKMDYREYGGAPLLGISKPVIKAHGSSDEIAVKNAIKQTKNFAEKDIIKIIEDNISISE